jgi:ubiquinone/menaquinone biosynthesis C-methylase UbiE
VSEPVNLFDDGKAYERMMGRWSRLVGEQFLDWLGAPPGLRWIDVGCGNGAFTEVLIARSAPSAVTGIDPSEGQLAYARTRPGASQAQFRIGSATALPFADDSFDAAAMALAITFVADAAKAAAEMARVVRPGGWVATYMWDIPGGGVPLYPVVLAMKALNMTVPRRTNDDASRCDVMEALWRQAGLQAVATNVIRIAVTFSDFDDFWESISAPVGPSGKAISDMASDVREEFKARLRDMVPKQPSGRIAYEAFANAVKGRVPQ